MAKRKFDDKATWRTDTWGIDMTQPARAERVFDPNDTVTDDPTKGGIAGSGDNTKVTHAAGVMYTGLNDNPAVAVARAYDDFQNLTPAVTATLTTSLTGANNDVTFSALRSGASGNAISVTYVDPGGATATLGVTVSGTDITVNLGRAASAINTTGTLLIAAVQAVPAAAALVNVANAAGNDGTGLVTALTKTNLAGGLEAFYS